MKTDALSEREIFLAYSRLFTLIADIFHRGLTMDNLDHVRAIPTLAKGLTQEVDWEKTAADHHHLFRFNVFAYESSILDPSGLLGGPTSSEHLQLYRECGFQPQHLVESPDHISNQLMFLAYIAEVSAREDPQGGEWAIGHSADFIDSHMFSWLAPFTIALNQQEDRFYASLANFMLECLAHYRSGLGKLEESEPKVASTPADLETMTSSPRELANYLLAPVYSGIYLGRDDIAATANRLSLPRGFGSRKQMLLNVIQSALTYDRTSGLIAGLMQLILSWETGYIELADQFGHVLQIPFWLGRLRRTKELLEELARESHCPE